MCAMNRVAVLILVVAAAVHAAVPIQTTVKVGVELVNVQFSVTDRRGQFITGLQKNDFLVEEDGRKQDIQFFSHDELPLTIGLLVDTSPSVRPTFDQERAAAIRFISRVLRPHDLALVMEFEKSVTLTQDFTDDQRLLARAIDDMRVGPIRNGGTSMYDALYLASREKLKEEAGRKAIVLISDGDDTTSKTTEEGAFIAAHASDVVVFSVAIDGGVRPFRNRGPLARSSGDSGALRRISEETGGSFFKIDNPKEFDGAFDKINEELRHQYSLAYVSMNPAKDGKYRRIRIISRDSSYRIQARKGYYAPRHPFSQ